MVNKTNLILLALITLFAAAALGIYLSDSINLTGNYYYSNGDTEFFIEKESDANSRVFFYFGNNPQPYFINMRNDPIKVEDIPVDDNVYSVVSYSNAIYITLDPYAGMDSKATIAALEIDGVVDNYNFFNIPVNMSLTQPYNGYEVRDCSNSTSEEVVILLEFGDETSVKLDGSCIIITGEDESELIRAADRLVYLLLGIIP